MFLTSAQSSTRFRCCSPVCSGFSPGFREVRVRILQHRILIAMPELLLQANVSGSLVIFGFRGALRGILIRFCYVP